MYSYVTRRFSLTFCVIMAYLLTNNLTTMKKDPDSGVKYCNLNLELVAGNTMVQETLVSGLEDCIEINSKINSIGCCCRRRYGVSG